ncbi:hypothetical protein RCL_jg2280.t1 [Rhizophagus clarus]|uniref:Uncharacterized protein n=1 Tax=Rhizophagus clarus TaxID=94130 RepID=A0A8H3QDK8_9GLOM|nr:hypothetical protein RCL_jg2280.t1 [Rhizophagus clarus]
MPCLLPTSKEIQNFMEHCWKKYLVRLKENNKLPKEYQTESLPTLLRSYQIISVIEVYIYSERVDDRTMGINHMTTDNVNEWSIIGKSTTEKHELDTIRLFEIKLFNDNDVFILTKYDLVNSSSCRNMSILFSIRLTLPLPNFEYGIIVSLVINNKECFLKYGDELLSYAILNYWDYDYDSVEKRAINYDNKEILLKYIDELC